MARADTVTRHWEVRWLTVARESEFVGVSGVVILFDSFAVVGCLLERMPRGYLREALLDKPAVAPESRVYVVLASE